MTTCVTSVELVWYEKQIEHWLRFGNFIEERFLDRRRRVVTFAPGQIFAFVRWQANDYGTVSSRLDILRCCDSGQPVSTVPGVDPGAETLLRLDRWTKVRRAFDAIATIEQTGIDPVDVSPVYWRHLHNRIVANHPHRAYTIDQHNAWLLRQRLPI